MIGMESLKQIAEQLPQPLWGRWERKEQLASAPDCLTYRLESRRMNRTESAVLKIIPLTASRAYFNDEQKQAQIVKAKERTERESDLLFRMQECPNIVTYQDEALKELKADGQLEGYAYLIRMEQLDCLTDRIRSHSYDLTEANVRALAMDLAKALAYAHAQGIMHRNIQPDKIFLSGSGTAKLGGFRVPNRTGARRPMQDSDAYTAPEIVYAKSADEFTPQADIYALGVCLYQLMNEMYLPFEKECDPDEAWDMRMNGEPFAMPENTSPAFCTIIRKCCAFDPAERYQSAEQLIEDLIIRKMPAQTANTSRESEEEAGLREPAKAEPVRKRAAFFAVHNENAEPESVKTAEPVTEQKPVAEAVTAQEPEAEAVTAQEPEAEAVTAQEPEAEAVTEQAPEAEAVTEQKPEAEAVTEQEPEAEAVTAQEPEAEAVTAQEPEAEAVTAQEPEAEAVTAQEPEAEAVTAQEPEAEAITAQEPEAEAVTEQETEAEVVTEQEPGAEAAAEQTPETEAEPAAQQNLTKAQAIPRTPEQIHAEQAAERASFVMPQFTETLQELSEQMQWNQRPASDRRSQRAEAPAAEREEMEIEGTVLVHYNGSEERVRVPAGITRIGNGAFAGNRNLRAVYLPDGLLRLEEQAFSSCRLLEEVRFPDSLRCINNEAFRGCIALRAVRLRGSLTQIGTSAFSGCRSMTAVTLDCPIEKIGYDAFYDCSSLTEINVSEGSFAFRSTDGILFDYDGKHLLLYPAGRLAADYIVPENVYSIGDSAFCGCDHLERVKLTRNVKLIGSSAFRNCMKLREVIFPENLETIKNCAFQNCTSL
ncbi:MAG: leucine-rich repeat protein, partial [Oscillospiraceae bacterium]|nr:leucine-rich repeat protein [Oscillospiraceae bacterium]